MARALLALVGLSAVLAACADRTPRAPAATAVTGVTLLDGSGGPPRPNVTVLVSGGTIASVQAGRPRLPRRAAVIDGRGMYLLPGFIDMHAHLLVPRCSPPSGGPPPFDRALSERMLGAALDFGVTTVRSPANPTLLGLALRDDLNAGRVRGPRAFASAELISDPGMSEADLRRYVRDALPLRPDYFKAYSRLRPEQVRVIVAEAHAHGVPVIGHLQRTSWAEGLSLGVDHLTHAVDWSAATLPAHSRSIYAAALERRSGFRSRIDWLDLLDLDGPEVKALIGEIARRGVSVDPTLVAYDGKFAGPDDLRYRASPYVDMLPDLHADWKRCTTATSDWTEDDHRRWRAARPKLLGFVRRMHDAGVLLTTGTDLTNTWVIPGEGLHQEFELLVEAGLSPLQVLRMTGANAARALRRVDVGLVAPGRRADLLLLSADPAADIRNTRRIVWVMQGGRIVSAGPPRPAVR